MAAIENKESFEKIKNQLKLVQEKKRLVEKANTILTDECTKLGNLVGMATRDTLKLEEEVKRLVADAVLAGVHEKED